jgi:hypothetical protein
MNDELQHLDARRAAQELLRREAFGEPWPVVIRDDIVAAVQELRREREEHRVRLRAEAEARNNEQAARERAAGQERARKLAEEERRWSEPPGKQS